MLIIKNFQSTLELYFYKLFSKFFSDTFIKLQTRIEYKSYENYTLLFKDALFISKCTSDVSLNF